MALLLVLIAAVVAFTVASAHLTSQSTTITIAQNVQDQAQARCVAESGMRIALAYVQSTATWRDDQSHGTWVSDVVLSSGTFTVVGEDGADSDDDNVISQPAEGDGDLSDSDSDLLTLTVTGRMNGAVHVVRAQVAPVLGGGGTVLLVTDDAHNLTSGEELTRDLIESWDYAIELISASDSQAEFDSAVAAVQVAYVAEDMLSSDLGTKLRDVSIGVVNEETALASEFAFSNNGSTYTGTAIDIVNNSHDITSPFPLGALTILTSSTELNLLGSSLASGADVLAERVSSSSVALIAIETGATLSSGAAAPGRRVDLPWGGNSFDITKLNDDGQTLMRRALDWAAMPSGGGLYDFTTGVQGTSAFAYDGQSTTKIPTSATAPSTVLSSGEYDGIEVDDSSSHSYAAGSNNNYPQMRFVLQTMASASTVGQLDITLTGRNVNAHPTRVDGVELHIWNYSTSAYEQLAVSASTDSEVTLTAVVSSSPASYLGGASSNTITLLAVARDAKGSAAHANTLYVDYVGVTVTTQAGGGGGGGSGSVEVRVAGDNDDAEEDKATNGDVKLNNDKLELGAMPWAAFRFTNVAIPSGATITSAYVVLTAADSNTESTSLELTGEDADSPNSFNQTPKPSARTKTSAAVTWNSVASWTSNSTYQTPSLTAIVQEIIDRPGWTSGNALALFLRSTNASGKRLAIAYDDQPAKAALLHVDYTTSGSGSATTGYTVRWIR